MANSYRLLQVTNPSIGPIPTDNLIPFGVRTRQIKCDSSCSPTFELATSVNNSLYINEAGFYKITYTSNLTVAAAGTITIALQLNGATVYTTSVTVAAEGTYMVSFVFMTRVFPNCRGNSTNIPMLVQLLNTGTALTGGNSNLIVERVYGDC